jgi:hypothetical protein
MRFPPVERDALTNLPFADRSPTLVAVLPLLAMLGLTGWAYRPAVIHSPPEAAGARETV